MSAYSSSFIVAPLLYATKNIPKSAHTNLFCTILYLVKDSHAFLGGADEHALVLRRRLLRGGNLLPQPFQLRLHVASLVLSDQLLLQCQTKAREEEKEREREREGESKADC